MNIYKSNTCRRDFNWLYFDDAWRAQKNQQVKGQQSCMLMSVTYLTYPSRARSTIPDMTVVFHAKLNSRFIEIKSNLWRKKLYRTNWGSSFLGVNFCIKNKVRASIQRRKHKEPNHYRRWFFFNNKPTHYYINKTSQMKKVCDQESSPEELQH